MNWKRFEEIFNFYCLKLGSIWLLLRKSVDGSGKGGGTAREIVMFTKRGKPGSL